MLIFLILFVVQFSRICGNNVATRETTTTTAVAPTLIDYKEIVASSYHAEQKKRKRVKVVPQGNLEHHPNGIREENEVSHVAEFYLENNL